MGPVKQVIAHGGEPLEPHDLWSAWSSDPYVWRCLGIASSLYVVGVRKLWHQAGTGRGVTGWQALAFGGGLIVLFIALISPLDALGGVLFSAHMLQHTLLMLVAAPLLIIGVPPVALAWSVPSPWRVGLSRWWHRQSILQGIWKFISIPVVGWALFAATLWLWHIPVLYQASVSNDAVHTLQHTSFIGTALLFWWIVVRYEVNRLGPGLAILSLFTTMLHSGVLGALMTFSSIPWYLVYAELTGAWGLSPLEDQQLAGVIMWIPGGVMYVVAILALIGNWLFRMERDEYRNQAVLLAKKK